MASRNLVRRLARLEEQLIPAGKEPLVIVVQYVSTDGEVSECSRVTVSNGPGPMSWQRP